MSKRVGRLFPFGTLAVNLSGALLLGLFAGLALSPHLALLAGTGFVGSYTTSRRGCWRPSASPRSARSCGFANIAVSVVLGLAAAWLGQSIGAAL